jgi:hypothetical protein
MIGVVGLLFSIALCHRHPRKQRLAIKSTIDNPLSMIPIQLAIIAAAPGLTVAISLTSSILLSVYFVVEHSVITDNSTEIMPSDFG